jgi:hypothetical protein
MNVALGRALAHLEGSRLEDGDVVGFRGGREVRFGLDWDKSEDPDEIWAADVTAETGALVCEAFFGGVSERVRTGDDAFDRDVMVCANLPQVVPSLFDASVRHAMLSLRFRFECSLGRVRISKHRSVNPEPILPVEGMIDIGVELANRVSALVASGAIPPATSLARHPPQATRSGARNRPRGRRDRRLRRRGGCSARVFRSLRPGRPEEATRGCGVRGACCSDPTSLGCCCSRPAQ